MSEILVILHGLFYLSVTTSEVEPSAAHLKAAKVKGGKDLLLSKNLDRKSHTADDSAE